ncbi:Transcription factor UNE12 [Sesamum angolense]|uniref:Transcription factor UNE12 n=1 Tax=Sesamum angolense TaxID=2727404 RepID=A0AAE2C2X1_9LAMI|nr:Transcription factor UNE12 [Sesamum angolense]
MSCMSDMITVICFSKKCQGINTHLFSYVSWVIIIISCSESDDMEGLNCVHDLQFLPMAINWIATNASGLLGDHDASQHYIMNPGKTNVLRHFSQLPSSRLADPSQLEGYLRPHTEGNFITTSVQKQGWTEDCTSAFQAYSSSCATESKYASGGRRKRSREKAYAADRCRRLRISHWLEALQELVPQSKEVGRAALLDEVIDHVRYLQFKMKDLSRSRLGGESTSNSFIFFEGHGHYLVQEQMLNGPLEEIMGKLIDVYPSAATELLQSRGLIVMPVNVAEGLRDPMETLDIQVLIFCGYSFHVHDSTSFYRNTAVHDLSKSDKPAIGHFASA